MKIREAAEASQLWQRLVTVDAEITMIEMNCDIKIVVATAKAGQSHSLSYEQRNTSPIHLQGADRLWEIVKGALLDRLKAEKVEIKLKLARMGVEIDA
jgi:hypothetical protein